MNKVVCSVFNAAYGALLMQVNKWIDNSCFIVIVPKVGYPAENKI